MDLEIYPSIPLGAAGLCSHAHNIPVRQQTKCDDRGWEVGGKPGWSRAECMPVQAAPGQHGSMKAGACSMMESRGAGGGETSPAPPHRTLALAAAEADRLGSEVGSQPWCPSAVPAQLRN